MEFSFRISDLKKSIPTANLLAGLSGTELTVALRNLLGKVAEGADLRIEGDLVTVIPPPVSQLSQAEVQRLYEMAGMRARKGEFEKAAGIYRRIVDLDPSHHNARRDLAMVLVETGDASGAKDLLLDVLKADPRDTRALVILGNHYAKTDGDRETAERFFRRAVEVNPEDATAHNSLGGMLFENGLNNEAIAEFDRALELKPDFPQPRYGKAMVFLGDGRLADARESLAELFSKADVTDVRNAPMLEQAWTMFLKLTNIAANDSASESFKAAEDLKARATDISGFRVAVDYERLPGIQTGRSQMAWNLVQFGIERVLVHSR